MIVTSKPPELGNSLPLSTHTLYSVASIIMKLKTHPFPTDIRVVFICVHFALAYAGFCALLVFSVSKRTIKLHFYYLLKC